MMKYIKSMKRKSKITVQIEQNINRNAILGPDHLLVRAFLQQW